MYNKTKKSKFRGVNHMKPRIFISSTFYDLKYIREDLANFVRAHDYEPVLFEDGDIGYKPGDNLDISCYESMKNSDMVILIIGSEYGSAASGEEKDEFAEYLSVTRKEFRTAIDSGIPILVMIDKKVMTEYGVYEANYDTIERENREMKFPSTKNINIFRFVKEVKSIVTLPIQEFEKSADIKVFISKQWADMFKNYLSSLRSERESEKIENSVSEMKILIRKMDIMLDSVGKNLLSKDDPEEYKNVINQQEILDFCRLVVLGFGLRVYDDRDLDSKDTRKELVTEFLEILKISHEKELWIELDLENDLDSDEIFDFFDQPDFYLATLSTFYINAVENKYELLYDEKNLEKILSIMITDEYFYELFDNVL